MTGTIAVVVTHRRPRLATDTIRMLVDREAIEPADIVLVVNGEGGLTDDVLEASLDVVRLDRNLGPAGGFRAGLERAAARLGVDWIYVCEDDICLLALDRPVLPAMRRAAEEARLEGTRVGAVVTYGRDLDPRSGRTRPHPARADDRGTHRVDCAAWGATLLHPSVIEAGVLPDPRLFFGFEDFDFFLQMSALGFDAIVDLEIYRQVVAQVTDAGRAEQFQGRRPAEAEDAWRHYYFARNFLELRRRHGHAGWTRGHLVLSARRWQRAGWSASVGRAIGRGLWDGFLGRLGPRAEYGRDSGELAADPER